MKRTICKNCDHAFMDDGKGCPNCHGLPIEIVKIQRPLASNEKGTPPLLVYDEKRRYVEQHDQAPRIMRQLGADTKGYFKAVRAEGKWCIGERVEDKTW
jgi:hypothetical protein